MESHPVDIHVGKKLRSRRTMLGRSQEEVGKAVGVTFQQIQKYERGLNRIGSSRLYDIARILGVSVTYFFEDFEAYRRTKTTPGDIAENASNFDNEGVDNKEVLSLVRAYYGISTPLVRRKILSLMKSLSSAKDAEEDDSTTITAKEKKLVQA